MASNKRPKKKKKALKWIEFNDNGTFWLIREDAVRELRESEAKRREEA